MEQIKQALKSRTVWYGIGAAVLSLLQGFVFHLPISPAMQAVIGCLFASGVVVFRAISTTSLITKA